MININISWNRFEKLIEERLKPFADKKKIDVSIWEIFGEEWCVMFTDLTGFFYRVEKFDIIHFLQIIYESKRVIMPIIKSYNGILLKVEGDSFLVIFKSVQEALQCSIAIQRTLKEYNMDKPEEETILLGIGLGYGRVLRIGDTDVFGREVNIASKLGEDIAGPWEILVSDAVRKQTIDIPDIFFEEIINFPVEKIKSFKLRYLLE
ncbi:MAG: adenylate/guanylate cyclase domain-containing protein [Desulfobacterales bacterium]|nr:adenylate/guanylate cyclase domain-containing protein [Desulfobacterales bacterium]